MYLGDSILETAFGADSRNGLFTNIRCERGRNSQSVTQVSEVEEDAK